MHFDYLAVADQYKQISKRLLILAILLMLSGCSALDFFKGGDDELEPEELVEFEPNV